MNRKLMRRLCSSVLVISIMITSSLHLNPIWATDQTTGNTIPEIKNSNDEDATYSSLTLEEREAVNMLSYISTISQEITSSTNSKLVLEDAYNSLYENTMPDAVDDTTQSMVEELLYSITSFQMLDEKRERLEYIYEQNKANAVSQAIPSPVALLSAVQSANLIDLAASIVYMAVDSAASYKSAMNSADLKYLQDGWELDDQETENLNEMRTSYWSYMVDICQEYGIDGDLTLNESTIQDFIDYKSKDNLQKKLRFYESHESTYEEFGPYWLARAQSYYENEDYQECLDCVNKYDEIWTPILRKDYEYAETVPLAVAAAEKVLTGDELVSTVSSLTDRIKDNTDDDDWSLRYFAAQTYITLYQKTKSTDYLEKAYDLVLDNVSVLSDEQRTLNTEYLADVETVEEPAGATKAQKKEVKQYNEYLKAERKTELAPISEPLLINCQLLIGLANKLNVSSSEWKKINGILHENDEPLFLVETIDTLTTQASSTVDTDNINVDYDKGTVSIPAKYISEGDTICVTISDGKNTTVIDDWEIDSVNRKDNSDIDTFTAKYTSKTSKKADYNDGMTVTVEILPATSEAQTLTFNFNVVNKKIFWIIPTTAFERA